MSQIRKQVWKDEATGSGMAREVASHDSENPASVCAFYTISVQILFKHMPELGMIPSKGLILASTETGFRLRAQHGPDWGVGGLPHHSVLVFSQKPEITDPGSSPEKRQENLGK